MYGNKGGPYLLNTATGELRELIDSVSTANARFIYMGIDILTSDDIEAETNEECKRKTEQWIVDNYGKALKIIEQILMLRR